MATNEALMSALMEKMGDSNPKMQLLAQLLQQQQQQPQEAPPAVRENAKVQGQMNKLVQINTALKEQLGVVKKRNRRLMEYLEFFLQVNSHFASAVGACECWGDDPACAKCQGRGKPGDFEKSKVAFEVYVQPCLEPAMAASVN